MAHPGALRSAVLGLVVTASLGCTSESRPAESPAPPSAPFLAALNAADAGSEAAAAAAPPPTSSGPAVAPARSLSDQATVCLDDPLCPTADADRLFVAADDAHEPGVDCMRFAEGDGTAKDPARARACLERAAAGSSCHGESADLARVELAVALTDGIGGPVDVPKARALFDGCIDDVTKKLVLDHARAREADAKAAPLNFCHDYGGTTLTSNECAARTRRREETLAAIAAKRTAAGLDDEGRRLFVIASKAYAAYVEAMGSCVYEAHRDGSNRNAMALAEETSLLARRAAEIAKSGAVSAAPSNEGDVSYALKMVESALAKQRTAGGPDVASAIDDAQAAWVTYRDAEIAFRLHAAGVREADAAGARRGLTVVLSRVRLTDLQAH